MTVECSNNVNLEEFKQALDGEKLEMFLICQSRLRLRLRLLH